jgi:hypothetical protein
VIDARDRELAPWAFASSWAFPANMKLKPSPNDLHVQKEQQGNQACHQQSKLPWRQALNAWLFV